MKKRLLPLLITFSALSVSGSAAFYSVTGLSKLFEFDTSIDTSKVQQHRLLPFIFSDDE